MIQSRMDKWKTKEINLKNFLYTYCNYFQKWYNIYIK